MVPGLGSGASGSVMRSFDALRAPSAIVRAGLSGAGGRFCAAGASGPAALRLYPSLLMYTLLTQGRRLRRLCVSDRRGFPVDLLTAGGLLPRRLSLALLRLAFRGAGGPLWLRALVRVPLAR